MARTTKDKFKSDFRPKSKGFMKHYANKSYRKNQDLEDVENFKKATSHILDVYDTYQFK